jgi:hypothetical protein
VREAYGARRKAILGAQERACELARGEVKAREGFAKLDADQSYRVLKPIAEAAFDTSATAIAPDLPTLEATFPRKLELAKAEANDRLEHELEKIDRVPFEKVALGLAGRELTTETQLDEMLKGIDEQLRVHIQRGRRVRLT